MSDQKVSVIIPVYNVQAYLEQCVNSVLKQTYHNLEVILIDDQSTDISLGICQQFKQHDDRVRLVVQHHAGNSQAQNNGLDQVTGDFITFVDSDDFVDDSYVAGLVNQMSKYHSDIAINMYRTFHEDVKRYFVLLGPSPADIKFNGCYSHQEWMARVEKMPNMLAGSVWGKLFKRELFKNIRFPLKMRFCEDANVLWKAELLANQISFENVVSYTYRTKRTQSITNKMDKRAREFEAVNIQERVATTAAIGEPLTYLQGEYRHFQNKRDLARIIRKYK